MGEVVGHAAAQPDLFRRPKHQAIDVEERFHGVSVLLRCSVT
jgi:hypothetical protein